jgi:hypothetical protein
MTTTSVQTISLPEAAFMLRIQLGPLRNWRDFLTDNIRGQQDIAGCKLMPCARRHDGRSYRPIYAVSDVKNFIANVQKAIPSAGRKPIKTTALAIDLTRHWHVNTFDKDGAPVLKRRSSLTHRQPITR